MKQNTSVDAAMWKGYNFISKEQAQKQLEKAEKIIKMLEPYLRERWEK